jgi:hypothetical protein
MIRLSMVLGLGLGIPLLVIGCDGGKATCDCQPTITVTSPTGGSPLTQLEDKDTATNGIQYQVTVQTTCIQQDQTLTLNNDAYPGTTTSGNVAIDDNSIGTGHIDFGLQTFKDGTDKLCVSGSVQVNRNSDGTTSCKPKKQTAEFCKDILVQGAPVCVFTTPSDGANLSSANDSDLNSSGFQTNVQVTCKGVGEGAAVNLIVNNSMPLGAILSGGAADWTNATLAEGNNILRMETTGIDGSAVAREIQVTVSTGGCVVRLSPANGKSFTSADATITVETEASGALSCADGSTVTVHITNANYQGTFYGTLANHKAAINVTLYQGSNQVYAELQDSANNKYGRSLVNQYSVSLATPYVLITAPLNSTKFGLGNDNSTASGFQNDVTCQFTGAAAGDTVDLYRQVLGSDANIVFVGTHTLADNSETSSYTFSKATLLPDPLTQGRVMIRCVITSSGGTSNDNIMSINVNLLMPQVYIIRPLDGAKLSIFSDMSSQSGFQTQVDVSTFNTQQGDTLILCVCHGTCSVNSSSTDRCQQMGYGATRYTGSVVGTTTTLSNIPFDQGYNTLHAFAENAPGQGTYSSPIGTQVDSLPPTVVSFIITSDTNQDHCINQAEAATPITAQVTVSDPGASLEGQTVYLKNGWPPGYSVGSAQVNSGGVANITINQSLGDGIYNLTATLADAFGNPNINNSTPIISDTDAQLALKVDTQAPSITITNPVTNILNSSTFTFSIYTTGVEDGQWVTFSPMGHTGQVTAGATSTLATLADGNYTLQASVSDACGNTTSSVDKSIQIDTTKPTITCSSPVSGTTFTAQQVSFVCHTSDPNSTLTVDVASALGNCEVGVTSDSNGDISFSCLFQNGTGKNLTLTATDLAGNVSDPLTITNISINVDGCTIAFTSGVRTKYNASNDKDTGIPDLQIDLTAHSSNCTSCCSVTLKNNGTVINPPGALSLDSFGNVTFTNVTLPDNSKNAIISVEIDDGAGHVLSDSFTVHLVKLQPPVLERRTPPGGETLSDTFTFTCVASTGNSSVDGKTTIADKIAGAPCDMDFQFKVTDGGDSTYPGSLSFRLAGSDLVAPTAIVYNPQTVELPNVQLLNNQTNNNNLVLTATDYVGNQATVNMTFTSDVIAPAVITAAAALGSTLEANRHADVVLNWNAVGEDENTGTATHYILKWSTNTIVTEVDWNAATQITDGLPNPSPPNSGETYTAKWLPPLNTYHFALRAVDEVGNQSPIPADVPVKNMWNSVTRAGITSGDLFAYEMWNIGDINNDGRDDLAVSAIYRNSLAGSVYIFYGSDKLTDWQNGVVAPTELTRNYSGGLFGWNVSVGYLDEDNGKDLVVSEFGYQKSRGRVTIYFGQAGGFGCSPPYECLEIRGVASPVAGFGRSAKVIGDINGDGFNDLYVSAPSVGPGAGYIFLGRSRQDWENAATADDGDGNKYIPVSATGVIQIVGENNDDWFGYRWGATTLGDLNSDGKSEFALVASGVSKLYTFDGATIAALTQANAGTNSVDIFHRLDITPDGFRAGFGHRTIGGIDFTGDSRSDLLVADAMSHRVYLFAGMGNPQKIDTNYTKNLLFKEDINFGWDLAAGDINKDGFMDFIAGTNNSKGDRAFIFLNTGTSTFFNNEPDSTLLGVQALDNFGVSVVVGDFNGDTLPDIVVGASGGASEYFVVYY